MPEPKRQRVRDPVHNLVEFDEGDPFERMLWRIISTPEFQRLRRVKQLGFSELVYPGAGHSRFVHSIGVFHTARQLMQIVRRYVANQPEERLKTEAALAAALVHDVGHGPFSHAFEILGQRLGWKLVGHHENLSEVLIRGGEVGRILDAYSDGFSAMVAGVVRGGPSTVYSSVVSSQFDADRLDYIRRDRLMTGTHLAGIDFDWLMANLEVADLPSDPDETVKRVTLVLGEKALYAAEGFVVGLFQLYPTVYFHKTTRCAEKMMQELLSAVGNEIVSGRIEQTGLAGNHPIVMLFQKPEDTAVLSKLDDAVITGALPLLADSEVPLISNFANRLRNRVLFKSIDLNDAIRVDLPIDKLEAERLYIRRREISIAKLDNWIQDGHVGRILHDRADRKPYKKIEEEGPMNQIWIRDGSGKLVDLREKSLSVAAIEPFRLFRAYMDPADEEAKLIVRGAVAEALKEA